MSTFTFWIVASLMKFGTVLEQKPFLKAKDAVLELYEPDGYASAKVLYAVTCTETVCTKTEILKVNQ